MSPCDVVAHPPPSVFQAVSTAILRLVPSRQRCSSSAWMSITAAATSWATSTVTGLALRSLARPHSASAVAVSTSVVAERDLTTSIDGRAPFSSWSLPTCRRSVTHDRWRRGDVPATPPLNADAGWRDRVIRLGANCSSNATDVPMTVAQHPPRCRAASNNGARPPFVDRVRTRSTNGRRAAWSRDSNAVVRGAARARGPSVIVRVRDLEVDQVEFRTTPNPSDRPAMSRTSHSRTETGNPMHVADRRHAPDQG